MGMLTTNMARLCSDIEIMRSKREIFLKDLKNSVKTLKQNSAEMQSNLRNNHLIMSRKMRMDQSNFMSNMKLKTTNLLAGFHSTRTEMSNTANINRLVFLSRLRSNVHALKSTTTAMLANLHNANDEMFKKTKATRVAFVLNIKQKNSNRSEEFTADLASTRQCWHSLRSLKQLAKETVQRHTKEMSERRTKVEPEKHRPVLETSGKGTTADTKGKKKQ
ncbi:MAG: hypothetical protein AB1489_10560 [Acidobacteriota bacterium]